MSNCNPLTGYPCRAGPCLKETSTVGSPAWFQIQYYRTKKINKQVRMPSSQQLLRNKSLNVTRWLAQGENGTSMNAGGPGDNVHSLQVSTSAGVRGNKLRAGNYGRNGAQNRTKVDEKHGSYARYLARKTGKVLRQETAQSVVERTAVIGQPRSRTGTSCYCRNKRTFPKNWFNTCCQRIGSATPTGPATQGRLPVA